MEWGRFLLAFLENKKQCSRRFGSLMWVVAMGNSNALISWRYYSGTSFLAGRPWRGMSV
ncbi:MAG: hypothetical protein LZF86_190616 [Nitrospira sp.]|nr:MAG: hypothetical protein LZF86_190616 [Nitrospira sp.]